MADTKAKIVTNDIAKLKDNVAEEEDILGKGMMKGVEEDVQLSTIVNVGKDSLAHCY